MQVGIRRRRESSDMNRISLGMAVKRAHLPDEDGFENGLYDGDMSSSESSATEALAGGEEACQIGRKIAMLSTEAQSLLRRTSRIMRKRRDGKFRGISEPLVEQLTSLRNLVPYSASNNSSCVISDALRYLDQLSHKVDGLQMELSHAISPSFEYSSKVEVTAGEKSIRVHVSCQKRPGLMADVLAELERLGLVFHEVNVSSHETFILDAVSTQVAGRHVCTDMIKKQVWRTISER